MLLFRVRKGLRACPGAGAALSGSEALGSFPLRRDGLSWGRDGDTGLEEVGEDAYTPCLQPQFAVGLPRRKG